MIEYIYFGDIMKKFIYNKEVYERLFKKGNVIIKYSIQSLNAWNILMCKNLPFLNIPKSCQHLSEEEQLEHSTCECKIELPFLNDYFTLYHMDFMHIFDSEQVLNLLRRMLISLKEMHEANVYHGDLFSKNIMINKQLDYSFIDLDAAIIENIIGQENTYFEDEISLDEKKLYTQNDDKFGLFFLFLYYFIHGNFTVGVDYEVDLDKLHMPKFIIDEINYCKKRKIIDSDYYFEDIVDELLSIGYEPKVSNQYRI